MASKTVVEWVDDLDGAPAEETVSFSLDGVEYEIDLSDANAARLRSALKEFIRRARPDGSHARRTPHEPVVAEPVPAPETTRSRPTPRSAIKTTHRFSANQLSMDVGELPEAPTRKPARTAREKPAAKAAPAKPKPATKPTHPAEPATPKTATPAEHAAVRPSPAPEQRTPPATEARPTVTSPFSQPTPAGSTPRPDKEDKPAPARPPMITFTSAKQ